MKILIASIVNHAWVVVLVVATMDMLRLVRNNNGWEDMYLYSSKSTPSEKRITAWLAGFGLTLFTAGMIKAFVFEEKGYAPLFLFSPFALFAVYVVVDYFLNKETPYNEKTKRTSHCDCGD